MSADLRRRTADHTNTNINTNPRITDALLHHDTAPPNNNDTGATSQSLRRKSVPVRQHTPDRDNVRYNPIVTQPIHAKAKPTLLQTRWRLFYLRPVVLLTFALLFLALLAALQIILSVSRQHHGLATTVESRHYLWKYGPTAVVVLLAAFWARVTYQAKLAQPWMDLARGPHAADRTVLADYVSLWEPTALVRSISHKRYLVAIAISCTLLLKVLTVLSTALIVGEQVPYNRTNVMFEANSFRNNGSDLINVGTIPMLAIAGALNTSAGWPSGTTEDYAFQTFNTSSVPLGSDLQARVEAFAGGLECDLADLSFANWTVITAYDPTPLSRIYTADMDFTTSDCVLQLRAINQTSFALPMTELDDLNTTTWRWAKFMLDHCGQSTTADAGRILVSVGELNAKRVAESINPEVIPGVPNGTFFEGAVTLDVTRSTSLICKPSYNITNRLVTLEAVNLVGNDIVTTISDADNSASHHSLTNVHTWDLAQAVDTALTAAADIGDQTFPDLYPDADKLAIDLPLRIGMRLQFSANPALDDLFDQTTLRDAADRLYRTLTAQIAHVALVDRTLSTVTGSAVVREYRILVQSVPAYVMSAILAVMATAAGIAVFLTPRSALAPLDPSTIHGFAFVAAESGEVMSLMRRNDSVKFSDPASLVSQGVYSSTASWNEAVPFSIQRQQKLDEFQPPDENSLQFHWFQPWVMKRFVQIPVIALVILIIMGLEVSLWFSRRHTGLGNVAPGSGLRYVWIYVPAMTLVLLSIYISGVDMCTKIFAPYHKLRRGCRWQAVRHNLLDQTPVYAMVDAVRSSTWAVLMTTVAAILASFLTIVVNGVFDTEIQSSNTNVQLEVDTWFPYDSALQFTEDSGTLTAGLILNANASYPAWTFENLALAGVMIKPGNTGSDTDLLVADSIVQTKIPALRTRYECRIYPDNELVVNYTAGPATVNYMNYTNALVVTAQAEIFEYTDGKMTSLVTSTMPNTYFGVSAGRYPEVSDFVFMWGKMGATDIESVSVAACNATDGDSNIPVEQVLVDVTLLGPGLQIDESNPPAPDESTIQNLAHFNLWGIDVVDLGDTTPTDALGSFFSTLVYGRYGIPIETLASRSNDPMVMDAIYRQLQIMQAQQINSYWRQPASETNITAVSYEGTVSNKDRTVLIQNAISTHILVAMLAVVLLLVLVSTFLMETHHVLPFEPTAIAAMASLLAHSNISNRDTLAELESDSSGKEKNATSPKIVKLGWFDSHGSILEDGTGRNIEARWAAEGAVFTINAINESHHQQRHDESTLDNGAVCVRFPSLRGSTTKNTPHVLTEERCD